MYILHALVAALLGTGALRMAAGVAIPSLEKRIVGGFLMPGVLAPYSVSLVKADGDKQYTCGGTIISNNFILTAAHCVISKANVIIPAANITMGYGNVDRNAQKKVKATGVFIHPQYISGSERDVRYDIALVEVKKLKFNKNTGSIPIYNGTIIAGQKLMAMGWGAAEDGATKLNMMRGTIVTTGDTESCQTYYRNFDDNNGPQLCTLGKLNPGSSTCTGDSGSSVVASRKDVVMLAGFDSIGVFTVGSKCGDENTAHFYIHAAYHLDFIATTTGITAQVLTQSESPEQPEQPEQPDQPDQPDKSDQPDIPSELVDDGGLISIPKPIVY